MDDIPEGHSIQLHSLLQEPYLFLASLPQKQLIIAATLSQLLQNPALLPKHDPQLKTLFSNISLCLYTENQLALQVIKILRLPGLKEQLQTTLLFNLSLREALFAQALVIQNAKHLKKLIIQTLAGPALLRSIKTCSLKAGLSLCLILQNSSIIWQEVVLKNATKLAQVRGYCQQKTLLLKLAFKWSFQWWETILQQLSTIVMSLVQMRKTCFLISIASELIYNLRIKNQKCRKSIGSLLKLMWPLKDLLSDFIIVFTTHLSLGKQVLQHLKFIAQFKQQFQCPVLRKTQQLGSFKTQSTLPSHRILSVQNKIRQFSHTKQQTTLSRKSSIRSQITANSIRALQLPSALPLPRQPSKANLKIRKIRRDNSIMSFSQSRNLFGQKAQVPQLDCFNQLDERSILDFQKMSEPFVRTVYDQYLSKCLTAAQVLSNLRQIFKESAKESVYNKHVKSLKEFDFQSFKGILRLVLWDIVKDLKGFKPVGYYFVTAFKQVFSDLIPSPKINQVQYKTYFTLDSSALKALPQAYVICAQLLNEVVSRITSSTFIEPINKLLIQS